MTCSAGACLGGLQALKPELGRPHNCRQALDVSGWMYDRHVLYIRCAWGPQIWGGCMYKTEIRFEKSADAGIAQLAGAS